MNKRHVFSTALAAITLASVSQAEDKSMKQASFSNDSVEMHRVVKESLERQITAKDLIGASVYDGAGEKIGDIADISMSSLLPSDAAQAFRAAKTDDDATLNSAGSLAADGTYASGTDRAATRAARDDMKKSKSEKSDWSSKAGMGSQATVFISVGGLWGIGDDIVAVPASSLRYNQAEEHFTLAASKSEVVALAEQDPTELDENFDWNRQQWNDDSEYSAKQSFDEDISDIRDAIQSDAALSAENSITISTKDNKLVLEGTVSSDSAKQRAETIAKEHSDMDVKNSIKVKK